MTLPGFLPKLKKPRLLVRRVVGESMLPTLHPGNIIVATAPRRIRVGDIVVIVHNGLEKIKRVSALDGERIFVRGDNPAVSTDSRQFGWLPADAVVAKVVASRRRPAAG